ncbi:MAG: phosphoglucomutase/phosphomannomutase family protein [Bacteroidota bacterium]
MVNIKFGTDGWRAIIAKEYTVDNVTRVAEGSALWMQERNYTKVVLGHDCRFGGEMFAQTTAQVFGAYGIKVYLAKGFVSTPMISLGVVKLSAELGVVITASHNPPSYNGYKLKSRFGGPSVPAEVAEVEALIPDAVKGDLPSLKEMETNGLLEYVDLEEMYIQHVRDNFDLQTIYDSGIKFAYDAMYGAGQNVISRLFPDATLLNCDYNPSFRGQAPEPIARNLGALSRVLKESDNLACGLANDGDADRIGMFDENGDFVDSHRILLLLLYYLFEHKGLKGKVIITFSVTDKMKKLAEHYGCEYEITKIGFKYIAEIMTKEDVLVGGEESGGLAVKGHIPERDGVWIGLLILEFMAKTGKSLNQLIQEVYAKVGGFSFDRDDLHITMEEKLSVVENCKNDVYNSFGDYNVVNTETIDGFKYYLDENSWVMIRPSGTEPVLRVYAQAEDATKVRSILDSTRATIL